MIRTITVLAAALSIGACTAASETTPETALDIPEVESADIDLDTMKDIVRTLSSDEFGGRMPGTEGEEKTVALLKQEFAAAGLKPGNNGSWVQKVPLVEITGSNFAPLTVTGGKEDFSFDYAADWVGVSYLDTPRTELKDSELVFVGYGINAPERGWNDYEGLDMTGKTAVILVNDPDYENETLEGPFGGRGMTYYGRWTYKYEEAARQGAAAALIVHDTYPASYGWNVVESSWSGPQAYPQYGDNPPARTQMNGWIQKGVAEKIMTAAGRSLSELSALAKTKGFKAVPLGMTASTGFDNESRSYESQNVVGVLPGSEAPDEYVLYTAHWDHLGTCTPAPDGDDICNGAVDNATGTAALVALAEAHAKAGPARRSVMFLAVTAEEQGLLGAYYYAANPIVPLSQTVGGVNMDAFLMAGRAKDVTVVGGGKSDLDKYLASALAVDGRTQTPDSSPEAGYYYRSDHFALAKQGVPMFYVDGGEDLVDGGVEAGRKVSEDYRANRYHGPKDEYDENWDWSGVVQDVGLFYRLGRMLAMSTSWPNWIDGDEFRATRDESCAAGDTGC